MPQFTAEELKTKTDEELATEAERHDSRSSEGVLINREWQRRERAAQYKDNKKQIELQHQKNMELVNKQLRWIKFSAILTAIATLLAVVLGWYLSEIKSLRYPKSDKPPIIQSHTEPSTSASHYEKKDGKVP